MSKQFWIVVGIILLVCVAAGSFDWLWRLHHSAARLSSNTNIPNVMPQQAIHTVSASIVHIEGCATFIQPPPSEKLEPRILPGASIENIRQVYGRESKYVEEIKEWKWQSDAINLQAWSDGKKKEARAFSEYT